MGDSWLVFFDIDLMFGSIVREQDLFHTESVDGKGLVWGITRPKVGTLMFLLTSGEDNKIPD